MNFHEQVILSMSVIMFGLSLSTLSLPAGAILRLKLPLALSWIGVVFLAMLLGRMGV